MKTANEFYKFFEAIPEERWIKNQYKDYGRRCCAYGHLKNKGLPLADSFRGFMQQFNSLTQGNYYLTAVEVNDSKGSPRQNILNFLQAAAEVGL